MPVETEPAILATNMNNKATDSVCAERELRLFLTQRDAVHASRFCVGFVEAVREFTFRCRLITNETIKTVFKNPTLTSQTLQSCHLGQTHPHRMNAGVKQHGQNQKLHSRPTARQRSILSRDKSSAEGPPTPSAHRSRDSRSSAGSPRRVWRMPSDWYECDASTI